MKTKKVFAMGVFVMAVWLGPLFQPQLALAAGLEAGAETETGMPDMESRVSVNPQESSQAGESTGQEADADGMMPDAPGGQDGDYHDPTTFSEETSCVISVTAAVPEHFGLAAYAEIISVESGVTYSLPLYASNGFYQRCYVPAGTYYVGNVAVYGDTTNEYPFDFPAGDFMVGEKDSFEVTVSMADFESVDAKFREKRGEPVESAVPVETDFAVIYSGTGNGQVGITGEQNGRYEILVEITESGYLGDGHFVYSLDGGETWQGEADFEIPLSGFYEIPLTGLTLEFAVSYADAEGFMAGDTYSASIPDPLARIRCERTGRGTAMVEVLGVDPDIQAFDALEASGMEFVIDIQKDGRLVRVSNLFNVIVHRYETRERLDNMLCPEDVDREICDDAGCCGSFGWMSVRDACAALRMGSQPLVLVLPQSALRRAGCSSRLCTRTADLLVRRLGDSLL